MGPCFHFLVTARDKWNNMLPLSFAIYMRNLYQAALQSNICGSYNVLGKALKMGGAMFPLSESTGPLSLLVSLPHQTKSNWHILFSVGNKCLHFQSHSFSKQSAFYIIKTKVLENTKIKDTRPKFVEVFWTFCRRKVLCCVLFGRQRKGWVNS